MKEQRGHRTRAVRRLIQRLPLVPALVMLAALLFGGCQTAPPHFPVAEATAAMTGPAVRFNPGDLLQVSFPGATAMNTTQRVQLNGNIQMPLVGEIAAAGKTPTELQADLIKAYDKELQVKQVVVILSSSSASIFVSGAVARPGRISMERPMNVLDAIMEAGGFDPKRANVKKVTVIRQVNGQYSREVLNLKPVLNGANVQPYPLQPFDIIYVPEKLF